MTTFLWTACAGAAFATARERVQRLRPTADLGDVELVVWTSASQAKELAASAEELLSFPFVRQVVTAHAGFLERFGILPADAAAAFRERFAGDDPQWVAAFVVPSQGIVLARPDAARDVHLLAHELGHMASSQLGYWRLGEARMALLPGRELAPEWVDLDGMIACWALEEGIAEVTARAAGALAEAGRVDWAELAHAARVAGHFSEPVVLAGPGTIVFDDLRITLAAGEQRVLHAPLEGRLRELAYDLGPAFVLAAPPRGDLPESHFAGLWQTFGGNTREVLFPSTGLPPVKAFAAALAERFAAVAPAGATRIGAFLLLHLHAADGTMLLEDAMARAEGVDDDLALRWDGDRYLWITRWRTVAMAGAFATLLARRELGADIVQQDRDVIADWGAPAGVAELLRR